MGLMEEEKKRTHVNRLGFGSTAASRMPNADYLFFSGTDVFPPANTVPRFIDGPMREKSEMPEYGGPDMHLPEHRLRKRRDSDDFEVWKNVQQGILGSRLEVRSFH